MNSLIFAVLGTLLCVAQCWMDGAPCKLNQIESMNPLQAEEHSGGLQLSEPPYLLDVESKCYWRNQPIGVILRGNSTKVFFKGFVIQPIIFDGPRKGKRLGKLIRLDNNGSWRQQCYRTQDSITNSHEDDKHELKMWWKNEDSDDYTVQFVATVLKSQRVFWVKSVLSVPIPPCKVQRKYDGYVPPPITPPPQTHPYNPFRD